MTYNLREFIRDTGIAENNLYHVFLPAPPSAGSYLSQRDAITEAFYELRRAPCWKSVILGGIRFADMGEGRFHGELIVETYNGLSDDQQHAIIDFWLNKTGAMLIINKGIDPAENYTFESLTHYYTKNPFGQLRGNELRECRQQLRGMKLYQTFGSPVWMSCKLLTRKRKPAPSEPAPAILLDIVYSANRAVPDSDNSFTDASTDTKDASIDLASTELHADVERSDTAEQREAVPLASEARQTDDGPTSPVPEWEWVRDTSKTDERSVFDVQLPAFFHELPADARLAWIQQARDRPF